MKLFLWKFFLSVFSFETIQFPGSLILKLALFIQVIVVIKGLCPYLEKLKVGPLLPLLPVCFLKNNFSFSELQKPGYLECDPSSLSLTNMEKEGKQRK